VITGTDRLHGMRRALRGVALRRTDVTPLAFAAATAVVAVAGSGRDVAAAVVLSAVGLATAIAALATRSPSLVAVVALAFGAAYATSLTGRDHTLDPFAVVAAVLVYLTVETIVQAIRTAGVVVDLAARRHHARTLARVAAAGAASAVAVVAVAAAVPLAGTGARAAAEAAAVVAAAAIVVVARRRTDAAAP
jgi:hypothetical protein